MSNTADQPGRQLDASARQRALLELTAQLSAALDERDVALLVATGAVRVLGASSGFVAVASDDDRTLQMYSHVNADAAPDAAPRLCSLDGSASLPVIDAWRDGRPILVRSATDLYARWPTMDATRTGRKSLAALPLDVDGERIGAINLSWAQEQPFDPDQQTQLLALAALCAQALRRARLTADLERMRTDVAVTASHELRTPLTAILGAATTLVEPLQLSERSRTGLLRLIVAEADRMRTVLDDLFVTAALAADRDVDVQVERVDVSELLGQVANTWDQLPPVGPALRLDVAGEAPPLFADPVRLRQVLMHLLDNASKYGPRNGTVTLRARVLDGSDRVRIEVVDEGPGMGSRMRARAFDRFWRGAPVDDCGVAGTGLGLYVSKLLVEAMGGTIALEPAALPAQGDGTCAVVELPAWHRA
jgi:signal transduction histidine kinase